MVDVMQSSEGHVPGNEARIGPAVVYGDKAFTAFESRRPPLNVREQDSSNRWSFFSTIAMTFGRT